MDPLSLLIAFGPSILGGLFNRNDPTNQMRKQVLAMLSKANISPSSVFAELQKSPMYAGQLSNITAAGQVANNAIDANVARAGGETSGLGQASMGAVRAIPGLNIAQLNTDLFKQATDIAEQRNRNILAGAGIAANTNPGRNYTQELTGSGLNAWLPYALKPRTKKIVPNASWFPVLGNK